MQSRWFVLVALIVVIMLKRFTFKTIIWIVFRPTCHKCAYGTSHVNPHYLYLLIQFKKKFDIIWLVAFYWSNYKPYRITWLYWAIVGLSVFYLQSFFFQHRIISSTPLNTKYSSIMTPNAVKRRSNLGSTFLC